MTYSALISEAKHLLQQAANAPMALPTAEEALAACPARAKLYRTPTAGATLLLTPPAPELPVPYRGEASAPANAP